MPQINEKDIKVILPLNALNGINGNPRQYLVFYGEKGQILAVKNLNFMDICQAIRFYFPLATDYILLSEIETTYKEVKRLLKQTNQ